MSGSRRSHNTGESALRSNFYLVFNLECMFEGAIKLLYPHNKGSYIAADPKFTNVALFYGHLNDVPAAKLPSQLAEARPYALWAAWIFLLSFASWLFLTSELCARLTEAILNNWREAEAQNDHQD
ncbi:hypothetical protein E2C01_020357 [Portunus trituberculatus]|uniref:Uncharacterized protein n=1 Tax=Portunus trituberculatus TaxID=210409 RepID=A0A5B7DZJ3_PORTR|nr:hypothetical protein [Portunus trituberculatus]